MKLWDHTKMYISNDEPDSEEIFLLDEMGKRGWELVSVLESVTVKYYYFKKPFEETE